MKIIDGGIWFVWLKSRLCRRHQMPVLLWSQYGGFLCPRQRMWTWGLCYGPLGYESVFW